jgi:hypothetical protein
MEGEGENSLAVVRIGFELSCPNLESFLGWLTLECPNFGEWHVCLTECLDQLGISQLTRRVVPISRSRVHGCRGEQAFGRIRPESFGREAGAVRKLSYRHEIVHNMKFGLRPGVRVKWG